MKTSGGASAKWLSKKKLSGSRCDDDVTVSTDATNDLSVHSGSSQPQRVFSPHPTGTSGTSGDQKKLGTINGVFFPCIQTILGVILFLRLTSITAQAGCVQTTLIILVCVTSTLLTALSLSAIATNGRVCDGGPYYVISRTLGVEIGGALGVLFYLGNTIATSMYVLGAIEAVGFKNAFPYDTQIASLILTLSITCVVSVGVKYVNLTSNLFMSMVFLSIFCMCLGCILFAAGSFMGELFPSDRVFMDNVWPNFEADPVTGVTPTFLSLLALFYPSATGILAGSNRSGLLADPSRSIPRGTISAIGTTTFIYVFVVWLFGLTISNQALKQDKFICASIAVPQAEVVRIGVIMSCIGASLQCLAGAPRLLAAIALDDSMPLLRCLKPRGGNMATPTRALWVTWFIASVPTLAGNLDHITPIITMFYLLMYAGINLSCFFLGVLKAPGFRPTFKYFHWSVSLFGFLWCLGLALVISWYTAICALALFFLLFLYNKKQKLSKDWGDVGSAIQYSIVTASLRALTGTTTEHFHAKNWRPQLLTFVDTDDCGNPTNLFVLSLASQLKKGQGINMVASIMIRDSSRGGLDAQETCELVNSSKVLLQRHMEREKMDGFAEVSATTSSMSEAVWSAVVHSGLGPLSPNTVMLSYPNKWQRSRKGESGDGDFVATVRGIMNLKKAVILFRGCDRYPSSTDLITSGSIDVWWIVHDGGLLLLLPYLLSKNDVWGRSGARLRLFAVTTSPTENPEKLRDAVTDHLRQVRISATVIVVDLSETSIAGDMRVVDDMVQGGVGGDGATSLSDIRLLDTSGRTVGEVFSNATYDVPYHAIVGEEDVEYGFGGSMLSDPDSFAGHSDATQRIDTEDPRMTSSAKERLKNAASFNRYLQLHSGKANLVVTNMPLIRKDQPASEFFDYVNTMCDGIDNVLLVRGSGAEVITTYV